MIRRTPIELVACVLIACAQPRAPVGERAIEYTITGTHPLSIDVSFPEGTTIEVCATPCRYHYERDAKPIGTLADILLTPRGAHAIRIRAPKSFLTALRRAGDTYVGTLDELAAPYAIGVAQSIHEGGTSLDVVAAPGSRASTDAEITAWLARSLRAVAKYYQRPPFARTLVTIDGFARDEIFGMADHHGEGSIGLHFGPSARVDGDDDWVATHELLHLAFPFVGRSHAWFSEGMATYVEPIARARAGDLDVREMWLDFAHGLKRGQPRPGDEGLESNKTRDRTYWGGALFYFVADLELRVRSGNTRGLEHALRALHPGDASIEEVLARADAATSTTVFRELYAKYALRTEAVDLDGWFRRLGIVVNGESVTFDSAAELAAIRETLTKRVE